MSLALNEVRADYQQLLERFWAAEDEAVLLSFNQLGMKMNRAGVPPEVAVETHAVALQSLQSTAEGWPCQDNTLLLPLMEVIMAYGVTFREQLSEQKATSDAQFYQVLEQSRDKIFITDLDGRVTYANPAYHAAAVGANGEAVGHPPSFVAFPDCCPPAELWEKLARGQAFRGVVAVLDSRQRTRQWSISAFPLVGGQGIPDQYVFLAEDISDQLSMTERLKQSERLATLGELASGISHEFNNILLIISGFAELVRDEAGPGPVTEFADEILKAVDKGRGVNEQILSFARGPQGQAKPVRLARLIEGIRNFLVTAVGHDIDIAMHYEEELIVTLDEGHLCQVLTNLFLNAKYAIQARNHRSVAGRIDCSIRAEDDVLLLTVEDNGSGMSQATRELVFEPFFTTRRTGEGSGLGLSIVLNIVNQYQGQIDVASELGRGTRFSLRMHALYGR